MRKFATCSSAHIIVRDSISLLSKGYEVSESLNNARVAITRLQNFIDRIKDKPNGKLTDQLAELCQNAKDQFKDQINDDLNISGALGKMFDFVRDGNKILDSDESIHHEEILNTLKYFNRILDVMDFDTSSEVPAEIMALAEERQQARADKNWSRSDEILFKGSGMDHRRLTCWPKS